MVLGPRGAQIFMIFLICLIFLIVLICFFLLTFPAGSGEEISRRIRISGPGTSKMAGNWTNQRLKLKKHRDFFGQTFGQVFGQIFGQVFGQVLIRFPGICQEFSGKFPGRFQEIPGKHPEHFWEISGKIPENLENRIFLTFSMISYLNGGPFFWAL